jgi:hypothetical protein
MASEDSGFGDEDFPGLSELEALTPEQAFNSLAREVPELLMLKDRAALVRDPIGPTQSAEELQRKIRDRQRGGLFNAGARRSSRERMDLRLELSRLVGPRAQSGSDLVRSNAAFFQCAVYLFAKPWESDSE